MRHIGKGFAALVVLLSLTPPASALTAELAKKCRAMALQAHPTAPPGSRTGTGAAQRAYFSKCVANNGSMPDARDEPKPKGRRQN